MRKPDYGIDAPVMQRNLAILGVVLVALYWLAPSIGGYSVWPGGAFLLSAAVMYWGSRVGKLRLRDRLLEAIPWRGDEHVLDVGCGAGLMLVGAAKRSPRGKAVGVDIWRSVDLSGNRPERTEDNARIERVADKVEVRDGDARELPFPDESFDVVLSSWALHNIAVGTGRAKAIWEIVRVLKPGGHVGILDIEDTAEYVRELRARGMLEVRAVGPSFLFLLPTYQVTARKPDAAVLSDLPKSAS